MFRRIVIYVARMARNKQVVYDTLLSGTFYTGSIGTVPQPLRVKERGMWDGILETQITTGG